MNTDTCPDFHGLEKVTGHHIEVAARRGEVEGRPEVVIRNVEVLARAGCGSAKKHRGDE